MPVGGAILSTGDVRSYALGSRIYFQSMSEGSDGYPGRSSDRGIYANLGRSEEKLPWGYGLRLSRRRE